MNATQANARKPTLDRAFGLVDPSASAARLAEIGAMSASAAASASWKDPIAEIVTDEELAAAGVTIADVAEAIGFFTATEAKITRERIGGTPFVRYLGDGAPGYMIFADGYRNGPAGG